MNQSVRYGVAGRCSAFVSVGWVISFALSGDKEGPRLFMFIWRLTCPAIIVKSSPIVNALQFSFLVKMLFVRAKTLVAEQEWMQVVSIFTAALVSLNSALLYAWPSPSIPILLSPDFAFNVTMEEASYTTVIPSIASIFSSPLYPYLMDKFGRKLTLLSVAVPQLLCWILISKANNIYTIYLSRLLSGFSNSCLYATLPVYIAEISSPNVRGLWGNAMSCCAYFGICLMNIIGSSYSIKTTANIFVAMPLFFFALFIAMPETPYFHLMNGEVEKAYKALKTLRRNRTNLGKEFLEMREGVMEQMNSKNTISDLYRVKSNRRAMFIAIAVRGTQQFAGISAFAVYAPYLFLHIDGGITAAHSAIIYTAALTICCFTGSILLNFLGRRKAMILSCMGCALVLLSVSAYFYFLPDLIRLYSIRLSYFPIVGMLIYVLVYSFGLGIIPNLLLGELFPSNVKANALCILNVVFGIYSSISTKVFQLLFSAYGMFAPLLMFGLCCVASTIFSIYCVPETSGRTLEQIQRDLKTTNTNAQRKIEN